MSSAEVCKQFVPLSEPTESQNKVFTYLLTLIMFVKDVFKKVNFEKKSADDNKSMKITQHAKS